ncbi:MAG TPA: SDR family oxidoreductase [Panacibacter sp.]|nr:SDR family oxidoreductase [Panacibacter sp.]HNP45767.1 SDR family oxidoreductase [Panacibacter sp.]
MENNELKKPNYVLITGGTSGIGYELAKLFAQEGYNLVIVARDLAELENTAAGFSQQYEVEVVKICKDLFDTRNAFALYEEVLDKGIEVSILVNDAGQGQYGKFIDTDIQRELDIIQLNISSLVVLTKLFVKDMLQRGNGKILNLSSIASKVPGPFQSVYHGTKAFVQSFTEAIRAELKDCGITVTALLPGATDTDFFNKAGMQESKIVQEGQLDDPAKVARDGFDALMSGDDKVVSGFKNKMQLAMSSITPDDKAAKKMLEKQKPVTGKD